MAIHTRHGLLVIYHGAWRRNHVTVRSRGREFDFDNDAPRLSRQKLPRLDMHYRRRVRRFRADYDVRRTRYYA